MPDPSPKARADAAPLSEDQIASATFLMSALVVVFALMGIVVAGPAGLVFVTEVVIALVVYTLWRMRN
ncbi:hypothetical protein [uncultured Maritimibacter sp.]|uniref:hypothetical protein n=1 Tax=uncultured Maritimibacter sp. TaxID=991866 RepID=UPI00259A3E70|nr:hypothetical protein [uncultured Maritimibacter sp.]